MTAVFIHIPKTGGSSIQEALELQQYRYKASVKPGATYSGLVTFGHQLVGRLIRRGLVPADCFFFAFVRNPYDRAVSLWRHHARTRAPDVSFLDFCRRFRYYSFVQRAPMFRWVDLAGEELDFLGRFETLQDDFNRLCGLLGVEAWPLPHLNRSNRLPCSAYYCDESMDIVRRRFAQDFRMFGYDDNHLPDG